ncbi:MAG TPA: PH domain-containing protein [Longimicrobium sp.]|nr:PH domain-containing protein [Longimicrobium sp.]
MFDALKAWLLRVLRVPPEPSAPEGGRIIRVFRAAPNYFRMKLILWGLTQLAALAGLVAGLLFIRSVMDELPHPWLRLGLVTVEAIAWGTFLAQLPFSLAVLRLDFEMRWYILSDRSLRIREGILSVREKTLTFANIQQVTIQQNPLQRLLGISDVKVSTAGGGAGGGQHGGEGTGESMHEACFRGVGNAAEIRTAIRERVRLHQDSGLGNPDEPALPSRTAALPASEIRAAAVELRDEIRALRRAMTPRR